MNNILQYILHGSCIWTPASPVCRLTLAFVDTAITSMTTIQCRLNALFTGLQCYPVSMLFLRSQTEELLSHLNKKRSFGGHHQISSSDNVTHQFSGFQGITGQYFILKVVKMVEKRRNRS